ncbi:MAG: phosphate-starvation-inducible PsiE family protein [Candidatus Polarisedimenticolaceae bacterium]|nr:phosphate-starvation-inducible PsiE family protein [Candidatus Polarisedimenticolaceae bacterium]
MNRLTESKKASFSPLNPDLYTQMVRILVGGIMLVLGIWLIGGVVSLLYQLYQAIGHSWSHAAENMITEVVIMLAVLELIRTLQSYLELGRVKVTLILDATLVVLVGELISLWYRDYTPMEVILSLGVISLLTLLRIITAKYSPEIETESVDSVKE